MDFIMPEHNIIYWIDSFNCVVNANFLKYDCFQRNYWSQREKIKCHLLYKNNKDGVYLLLSYYFNYKIVTIWDVVLRAHGCYSR